jgi:hypothetical protein
LNFIKKIVKVVNGVSTYNLKGKDYYSGYGSAIIRDNIIIVSGSHARGRTAHIFLVDCDDYIGNIINCPNKLEIYGIVSGQPGWDEVYGWLHSGSWVKIIEKLVDDILIEIQQKEMEIYNENEDYKNKMQETLNKKLNKFENMFKS